MTITARGEAGPEGAQEAVTRELQAEAWEGGGDQGRVRTAFGRKCARAEGARAYRALLRAVAETAVAATTVAATTVAAA